MLAGCQDCCPLPELLRARSAQTHTCQREDDTGADTATTSLGFLHGLLQQQLFCYEPDSETTADTHPSKQRPKSNMTPFIAYFSKVH